MNGYRILENLYKSERVSVFRAVRESDGKTVIIKSQNAEYPGLRDLTRIKIEYDLSTRFSLTGMVPILALEKEGNGYSLVMEDVGGIPLPDYWKQSVGSISIFLNLAIGTTWALAELHKNGIIHKDIKPANILVQKETGRVYLIDLGLASLLQAEEQAPVLPDSLEGTLSYISPEQTGRMNRSIDFRTDLYSLGITFYELLTGELPFKSVDPVELVHAHIAVSPKAPMELNPSIPPALSDMILKLLSKNAEDRYHSADGVLQDLELSKNLLERNEPVKFIPGEKESRSIFTIPQKLYGREAEVSFLLDAFNRIAESPYKKRDNLTDEPYGGVKLVLVGGYSGVGKTALIHEIHKPILEKRGHFLSGKFDQFKRNIPYSALIYAFSEILKQILTENEESIRKWKQAILSACSPNTALLTDLIPELIPLLGKQPPIEEHTAEDTEERFRSTLLKFIGVFAKIDHPLTLFIDDLQWADPSTLKLLELLTKSKEIHHLYLIGAYRDNEVDAIHPLTLTIQNLEKEKISILKIFLAPLMEFFIERMICDTLFKEVGSELPELVYQKTAGNPFFVRHLLKTLHRDGCIFYHPESGWLYDIEKIHSSSYSENVVEMVANRLKALSPQSLEVLKIASCIGANFSLSLLSLGFLKSPRETALSLQESLREGILLPVNSMYRSTEVLELEKSQTESTTYRFIHDRVQQAANSILSEEEKKKIHGILGKALLDTLSPEEQDTQLFEIVNHLNYKIEDVLTEEERQELIDYNYRAGCKANESYAYDSAVSYFEKAVNLISTENSNERTFRFQYEHLNALYKSGKVQETMDRVDHLFTHANTKYEKAQVYNLKVLCCTNLDYYEESVKTCINALRLFDVEIKENISIREIYTYYRAVNNKLTEIGLEKLDSLDSMNNPEIEIIMNILMNTTAAAYWKLPSYSTFLSLTMIDFTLKFGLSETSAYAFSSYGVTQVTINEFKSGYNFGKLARSTLLKYPSKNLEIKISNMIGVFINNWIEHSRCSINLLEEALKENIDQKDIIYISSNIANLIQISFIIGNNLENIRKSNRKYLSFFQTNYSKSSYYVSSYIFTYIDALSDRNFEYVDFENKKVSLKIYEQNLIDSELKIGLFYYYTSKIYFHFLFHNSSIAYETYLLNKPLRSYGIGLLNSAQDIFISSLLLLKLNLKEPDRSEAETKKDLESYIKQYKTWAEVNPANFKHKYNLILAEYAKYKKEYWEATEYYDIAIESAIHNEYNLDAGLCAELAATFYLEQNRIQQAKKYFQTSLYYYDLCGAKAKVRHVRELYPEYTVDNFQKSESYSITSGTSLTRSMKSGGIDITSVLRATSALAEERTMETLLSKLMKILVENAGATRTVLVDLEEDTLFLQAEFSTEKKEVEFYRNLSINDYPDLPHTLFGYIKRTGESVLLGDVKSEERWNNEPYYHSKNRASVLSFPILNKGSIKGILYLENTNSTNVFTEERLNVLQMISGQASISMENAKLYESMELKIRERTLELEAKNKSIEELNIFIKSINESSDLNFILDKIHKHIRKNFNIEHFGLGIADKDSSFAKTMYLTYPEDLIKRDFIYSIPIPVRNTKGAHSLAFASNKPFYVKRIRIDRIPEEEKIVVETFNLKSLLILPLILKGENIGYFDLFNGDKELTVTKEEINQLSILAEQLAGIIYSSNLYKELQTQKQQLESTLTELRDTQAQLVEAEKSAALGQLISGVAHEINNPLAAIRSSAEVLEMEQEKILEEIPLYFQSLSPENYKLFLELQKKSEVNRRVLTTKEERQRKKKVSASLGQFSFSSPEIRDEISSLLSELWLEEAYPSLREIIPEKEVLQFLKYISALSTQKLALKNIKLSTEKSARIIFSLRKFLKTDIRGTPRDVTLVDLIESSLRVYDNYIRGIVTIEREIKDNLSLVCVVDEIQQVFKNIIFNAIQSMYASDSKILKIRVNSIQEYEKSIVRIEFEDTGHGVSADIVHKLFTPFFTTKSRGEGIGLGLHVSRLIVEEYGGSLDYEGIERGSRFIVKLMSS